MQAYPRAAAMDPQHIKESSAYGVSAPMDKHDTLTSTQLPSDELPFDQLNFLDTIDSASKLIQSRPIKCISRYSVDSGISFDCRDSDTEASSPCLATVFPLTKKNLSILTMSTGGKPRAPSSLAGSTTESVDYKHGQYMPALANRGIISSSPQKPSNHDKIKVALSRTRDDEPSEDDVQCMIDAIQEAPNEASLTSCVIPAIIKSLQLQRTTSKLSSVTNAKWELHEPLVVQEKSMYRISAPWPDETIGYNSRQMNSVAYGAERMGSICTPLISAARPLCPFFTVEAKAWQSGALGRRQNTHNAAVMLRNLRKLREINGVKEEDLRTSFDGEARVFTLTFSNVTIELHYAWTAVDEESQLIKYHFRRFMFCASPPDDMDDLKSAINQIRNAMDYFSTLNKDWVEHNLTEIGAKLERGVKLPGLPGPLSKAKRKGGAGSISLQGVPEDEVEDDELSNI